MLLFYKYMVQWASTSTWSLPRFCEPLSFTVPRPVQIIQGEREEASLHQVKNYLREKGASGEWQHQIFNVTETQTQWCHFSCTIRNPGKTDTTPGSSFPLCLPRIIAYWLLSITGRRKYGGDEAEGSDHSALVHGGRHTRAHKPWISSWILILILAILHLLAPDSPSLAQE